MPGGGAGYQRGDGSSTSRNFTGVTRESSHQVTPETPLGKICRKCSLRLGSVEVTHTEPLTGWIMSAQVISYDAPNCVFDLEERNRQAQQIITSYAVKHAAMDVSIGLLGLLPIPGAATTALIGAILAQAPLVYDPMTRDLAGLYSASSDSATKRMQNETVAMGAVADVGVEFLREIAMDLLGEAGFGLGLSLLPVIGGFLAAGVDATIAATLTWRVGTMVSAYYQNGGSWIQNRKFTYKLASGVVGGYSPRTHDRADLNQFARENTWIREKHLAFVMNVIDMLRTIATNKEQIRSALAAKNIPSWLAEGRRTAPRLRGLSSSVIRGFAGLRPMVCLRSLPRVAGDLKV
jgi:hypothetical protein